MGLLVCPCCRGALEKTEARYGCVGCGAEYPIVAGIPDLRVAPDPWIGLAGDREKALRLEERVADLEFADAVRAYWEITPETPRARAERFIRHALSAEIRSRQWVAAWNGERPTERATEPTSGQASGRSDPEAPWLDLGCGTGDLAAAAVANGARIVAADIALRWLVVARRRPELAGGRVDLVCCCAERLPFPDATFGRVLSLGLLEHCRDVAATLSESRRVLRPGGSVRMRTVNRYSPLPEPHVGVWGVGFVPRALADAYVRWRTRGTSGYEHHRPLSRRELRRELRGAGLRDVRVLGARPLAAETRRLGLLGRRLAAAYGRVRRAPVVADLMAWVAPLLEASGRRE